MPVQKIGASSIAVCATLMSVVTSDMGRAEEQASLLFVQSAEAFSFDGKTMTLTGLPSNMTWFTNRPEHKAGQLTLTKFQEVWSSGNDSFAADPPNAVLHMDGSAPAIVELSSFTLSDDAISYDVIEVLDGSIPASGSGPVLILDSYWPLEVL